MTMSPAKKLDFCSFLEPRYSYLTKFCPIKCGKALYMTPIFSLSFYFYQVLHELKQSL